VPEWRSRMRWVRRTGAVALCLFPAAALAQGSPIVSPPTVIAPNFEHEFPGLVESLEAGADLVQASDAPALFYNPAGLIRSDRTTVYASAQGWELTLLNGTGLDQKLRISNFRDVPNFLGTVLGREVLPWKRVRVGLAFSNPIFWQQSTDQSISPADGSRVSYWFTSGFRTFQVGLAGAYRFSSDLRVGLALNFPYTTLEDHGQISGERTTATASQGWSGTLAESGYKLDFRPAISAQWDVLPVLSLGAMVDAPGWRILGGGSVTAESLIATTGPMASTTQVQTFFRDTNASFEFRHPMRISVGAAVHKGPAGGEIDFRWHSPSQSYALFSSTQQTRQVTTSGGSAPVSTSAPFPDQTWATRGFVSGSIGGHVKVSRLVTLHGGFYADPGPGDARYATLQRIDLYGARAGFSLRSEGTGLSGSLGLGYEFGNAEASLLTPTGTVSPSGTLHVQTVSVLFAVAYKF
jgi:hypothetical protein